MLFGNELLLLVFFCDLLLPLAEPGRDDHWDAGTALGELLGHRKDHVVFNVLALTERAVFAELPLLQQLFEKHITLVHRRHLVAEFVEDQAQLVDVLCLVDLNVVELLRKSAGVVVLLDLRSHVHFSACRRREVRIDSFGSEVSQFLHSG